MKKQFYEVHDIQWGAPPGSWFPSDMDISLDAYEPFTVSEEMEAIRQHLREWAERSIKVSAYPERKLPPGSPFDFNATEITLDDFVRKHAEDRNEKPSVDKDRVDRAMRLLRDAKCAIDEAMGLLMDPVE